MSRDRAIPGDLVSPRTCGKRNPDDGYCGAPVEYEIRFKGWEPHILAGACAEHAAEARQEIEIESIWSVTR